MSPLKQIAVSLCIIAAGAGVWAVSSLDLLSRPSRPGGAATAETAAPGGARGLPVIVSPVQIGEDDVVVRAVGSGEAEKTVTIFPSAAGEVVEVTFEAGDKMAAGQTLVQLDDEEEALAVQLAKLRIQDARQLLQRYEQAVSTGAVSASEVDAARTALDEAKIQLAQAEVALSRRRILAPFDGVVGLPRVDLGDRVTEATEITTLDDRSAILIDFDIPEAHAGRVKLGDAVTATTWALPGERFSGTISAIESRIDPATRTLRLRARVTNEDDRLRTGMSFAVSLAIPGAAYPSVPEIAVQWGREGAYVWAVRDGAARRVDVLVRQRADGRVLVEGDIARDELVVVEGVVRLHDGRKVDPIAVTPEGQAGAEDPEVAADENT